MNTGHTLVSARTAAGLGLREAARLAGTSHATLSAYEKGQKTPSVNTFLRILEACNYSVDIALHPRIREHRGLSRGDELVQVLQLTEQFPAKHKKTMGFPQIRQAR